MEVKPVSQSTAVAALSAAHSALNSSRSTRLKRPPVEPVKPMNRLVSCHAQHKVSAAWVARARGRAGGRERERTHRVLPRQRGGDGAVQACDHLRRGGGVQRDAERAGAICLVELVFHLHAVRLLVAHLRPLNQLHRELVRSRQRLCACSACEPSRGSARAASALPLHVPAPRVMMLTWWLDGSPMSAFWYRSNSIATPCGRMGDAMKSATRTEPKLRHEAPHRSNAGVAQTTCVATHHVGRLALDNKREACARTRGRSESACVAGRHRSAPGSPHRRRRRCAGRPAGTGSWP